MTTIAWDGRALAADTLSCWDMEPVPVPARKILPITHGSKRYLVGITGCKSVCMLLVDHFLRTRRIAGITRPFTTPGDDKATALVIELCLPTPRVTVVGYNGGTVEVNGHSTAIGSGGQFAQGAMWAGADAEAAVRIAMKGNIQTGGTVQVERIDTWLAKTDLSAYIRLHEQGGE